MSDEAAEHIEMLRLCCPFCSWTSPWRPVPGAPSPHGSKELTGAYWLHYRDKHLPPAREESGSA